MWTFWVLFYIIIELQTGQERGHNSHPRCNNYFPTKVTTAAPRCPPLSAWPHSACSALTVLNESDQLIYNKAICKNTPQLHLSCAGRRWRLMEAGDRLRRWWRSRSAEQAGRVGPSARGSSQWQSAYRGQRSESTTTPVWKTATPFFPKCRQ